MRHDELPDGRTGPFLRIRHFHDNEGQLLYDPRCRACMKRLNDGDITPMHAYEEMNRRNRSGEKVRAI